MGPEPGGTRIPDLPHQWAFLLAVDSALFRNQPWDCSALPPGKILQPHPQCLLEFCWAGPGPPHRPHHLDQAVNPRILRGIGTQKTCGEQNWGLPQFLQLTLWLLPFILTHHEPGRLLDAGDATMTTNRPGGAHRLAGLMGSNQIILCSMPRVSAAGLLVSISLHNLFPHNVRMLEC